MFAYGFREASRICFDLLRSTLRRRGPLVSFEDFAVRRFGRTLARRILLNYSSKLWGLPTAELSPDVATRRLQGMTLRSLLYELVIPGRRRSTSTEASCIRAAATARSSTPSSPRFRPSRSGRAARWPDSSAPTARSGASTSRAVRRGRARPGGLDAADAASREAPRRRASGIRSGRGIASAISTRSPPLPEARLEGHLGQGLDLHPRPGLLHQPDLRAAQPIRRDGAGGRDLARGGGAVLLGRCSRAASGRGLRRAGRRRAGGPSADRAPERRRVEASLHSECVSVYASGYERDVAAVREALAPIDNLETVGRAGRFVYSHLHDQLRFGKDYCVPPPGSPGPIRRDGRARRCPGFRDPAAARDLEELLRRMLVAAGTDRSCETDRAWVESILTGPEPRSLVSADSAFDQDHVVQVARRSNGGSPRPFTRRRPLDRRGAHARRRRSRRPGSDARAGSSHRRGPARSAEDGPALGLDASRFRGRIGAYLTHGEIGARLIRKAGGRPRSRHGRRFTRMSASPRPGRLSRGRRRGSLRERCRLAGEMPCSRGGDRRGRRDPGRAALRPASSASRTTGITNTSSATPGSSTRPRTRAAGFRFFARTMPSWRCGRFAAAT